MASAVNSISRGLVRVLLVILGVLFTTLWISAHMAWASMTVMANVMANDSGQATLVQHLSLIVGVLGGQAVAGLAGIPGGLAFFWTGARKRLFVIFAILFVSGAVWQVLAVQSFFTR